MSDFMSSYISERRKTMNDITLTLILSLCAALGVSICRKYYAIIGSYGGADGFIFNAVGGLVAAAVLFCWGGVGPCSTFTVLLGLAFGAVTALQSITNFSALQCGPMSYTSVIISFSTVISALSGVIFFDESIGWSQIVGIILMLVSFVLAAKGGDGKKANLKWLMLCLIAFAATGGIGIMQKVHQSSQYRDELGGFLIIAFVSSAAICALFSFFMIKRSKKAEGVKASKKPLWLVIAVMAACGVGVAVNNKFNLYLSGVMPSAVFFPIVNGGGLVLSTLAALLIFKERLTRRQWVGVVIGIASVVFLCDPFG